MMISNRFQAALVNLWLLLLFLAIPAYAFFVCLPSVAKGRSKMGAFFNRRNVTKNLKPYPILELARPLQFVILKLISIV